MSTLKSLLDDGTELLEKAGVPEAAWDAWLLMEYRLGINRAVFLADPDREVSREDEKVLRSLFGERARRIPLQHLTGEAWFYGLCFKVNEHVLIPRQDTEILVETALEKMKDISSPRVLDLCTGSGCVLLAFLSERTDASGIGVDISREALLMAGENARKLDISRAGFIQRDILSGYGEPVQAMGQDYDLLLSNPPYIETEKIDTLMEEVRSHDPRIALDGGEDGLIFYRRIVSLAPGLLRSEGWLAVEIGSGQGDEVMELFRKAGFRRVMVTKDLAGLNRVVSGQWFL